MEKVYLVLKKWTDSNDKFIEGNGKTYDRYFDTEEEALEDIKHQFDGIDRVDFQFEIKVIYQIKDK